MRHTLQWHLFEGKENSNENKQTTENLDFKRYNNQYGKLILYYFTDSRQLGQERRNKIFSVSRQNTIYLYLS